MKVAAKTGTTPTRLWNTWKHVYGDQKAMIAFILIGVGFGGLFVLKTPPLWGGDETTHYARAYEISTAQWATKRLNYPWGGKSYGDEIPQSLYDLIWHVNDDITYDKKITNFGTKRIDDIKSYDKFTDKKLNSQTAQTYFFPNTAVYSPAAYIPSALAIKASSWLNLTLGQSIYLARFAGLALYIACVAFALRSLKDIRFAWLIFALALIPMQLFEASIISADLTVSALALLLVGLVAKAIIKKSLTMTEVVLLSASVLLLPVVKPTYVFLSFAILLVPGMALAKKVPISSRVYKLLILAAALLLLMLWTYHTRGVSQAFRLIGTGDRWGLISISGQTHFLTHHPLSFIAVLGRSLLLQDTGLLVGFFGMLSFDFISVPGISIISSIIAILMALGLSEKADIKWKQPLAAIVIAIAGIVGIYGSFYLTFSNVAEPIVEGVQGRYFFPFAVLALTGLYMAATKTSLRLKDDSVVRAQNMIIVLCVISLLAAATKFFYVLLG